MREEDPVPCRTWQIPGHTIDLIVEGCVIAELKSVSRLKKVHERQVVSYLKADAAATRIPDQLQRADREAGHQTYRALAFVSFLSLVVFVK